MQAAPRCSMRLVKRVKGFIQTFQCCKGQIRFASHKWLGYRVGRTVVRFGGQTNRCEPRSW